MRIFPPVLVSNSHPAVGTTLAKTILEGTELIPSNSTLSRASIVTLPAFPVQRCVLGSALVTESDPVVMKIFPLSRGSTFHAVKDTTLPHHYH